MSQLFILITVHLFLNDFLFGLKCFNLTRWGDYNNQYKTGELDKTGQINYNVSVVLLSILWSALISYVISDLSKELERDPSFLVIFLIGVGIRSLIYTTLIGELAIKIPALKSVMMLIYIIILYVLVFI